MIKTIFKKSNGSGISSDDCTTLWRHKNPRELYTFKKAVKCRSTGVKIEFLKMENLNLQNPQN